MDSCADCEPSAALLGRLCPPCCGTGFVEIQNGPYSKQCPECQGTGYRGSERTELAADGDCSLLKDAILLLHEAGLLAQIVRHPELMRQSWADGSEAMNCGEAGRMLGAAAQELEDKIAAFLKPNKD